MSVVFLASNTAEIKHHGNDKMAMAMAMATQYGILETKVVSLVRNSTRGAEDALSPTHQLRSLKCSKSSSFRFDKKPLFPDSSLYCKSYRPWREEKR